MHYTNTEISSCTIPLCFGKTDRDWGRHVVAKFTNPIEYSPSTQTRSVPSTSRIESTENKHVMFIMPTDGRHISSVFTCFCIVQRVDPVRLRGHIVSSAHSAVSPCGPAWPAARSGKLGWWSDELTQRVALWGNFGKNAFSLHFRNKFDLQN